jgi:hypothetical protein
MQELDELNEVRTIRKGDPLPLPTLKPINRDDFLRADFMVGNDLVEPSQREWVVDGIRTTAARAEWFDFGTCDVQATVEEHANTVLDMVRAGVPILPPFRDTVFRYRLNNFSQPKGLVVEEVLVIETMDRITKPQIEDLLHEKLNVLPAIHPVVNIYRCMFTTQGAAIIDRILRWGSITRGKAGHQQHGEDTISAFFAFWSILNTRNIRKRVVEPAPKLQNARRKSGKPPLRRVTYIDTAQFEAAAAASRETERTPGHHASPHMHLRRGHLWTLPNGKGKRWRRHCIVNADHEYQKRDHYKVEQGK